MAKISNHNAHQYFKRKFLKSCVHDACETCGDGAAGIETIGITMAKPLRKKRFDMILSHYLSKVRIVEEGLNQVRSSLRKATYQVTCRVRFHTH